MASLSDDFNRSNADPMGAPWVQQAIQATTRTMAIQSDQVTRGGGSDPDASVYHPTPLGADQAVEMDFASGSNSLFLIARLADPGDDCSGYLLEASRFGTDRLYRIDSGWDDSNGGVELDFNVIEIEDGTRFKLKCSDSAITAEYKPPTGDWTEYMDAVDATYAGGGFVGFGGLIFSEADNFLAYDLDPGPGPGLAKFDLSRFPIPKLRRPNR